MGSLMAGWSAPFIDPDSARLERNRSATKEEIESFWKKQKMEEEDEEEETNDKAEEEKKFWEKETEAQEDIDPNTDLEASKMTDGWWTKSNWAYLNEPPKKDESTVKSYKYTAQFHVAEIAVKKSVYAV